LSKIVHDTTFFGKRSIVEQRLSSLRFGFVPPLLILILVKIMVKLTVFISQRVVIRKKTTCACVHGTARTPVIVN